MPNQVPRSIILKVIRQWLQGPPRDMIALQNGLSAGAITNIINKWKQQIGLSHAEELRDFAVSASNGFGP